jgi:hypothetical protein
MEKGIIQFIQVTPDQLQEAIISGLKKELDKLKKEFQPKESVEFLTRNEVKEMLKVDLSTIHNWTKKGKLKSYGIGNRVYYKLSEIEAAFKPLF